MTPKFHSLKIKDVIRETDEAVSISFEIPEELQGDYQYKSGQYLTLRADINGEEIRRSYSLCSAPHEKDWRVAVKQVENGRFSTYANNSITAGMEMQVMTPMGNFVVDKQRCFSFLWK
jgi:ring-1,2-phenylacetyl-CoA epoxidase subunit PaaE